MTDEYKRPDPNVLLARIQSEEERAQRGKLHIFLGYVAGVGKTYSMLEAAHRRKEDRIDVVIGYIETHGRKETEALVSGLEIVPRRVVEYHAIQLTEMDLDALIKRHPRIALVDELAHTNNPGSRHPKRYQDVEEILAAGIDVYTTVNIQHLESLADIVQQITGVVIRERLPDRLIDEADEIELIDLPTDELLKRLEDGKVYVTDQTQRALEQFFRKGNLTALRELSLRKAAKRVDSQMIDYMQTKAIPGPWPANERILVCISSHPMSERLIRSGRRLADELNAEWFVLFVETVQHLRMPLENQVRIQHCLNLAKELGAITHVIPGESVADTALQFARQHNITKIMAGKPLRPRWQELIRGSVIDQIIRDSGNIDVEVVSDIAQSAPTAFTRPKPTYQWLWRYAAAGLLIAAVTLVGELLSQFLDPTNLVMVYLLAVVIAALYLGRGPAIMTSIVSVLAFDFFFVTPIASFNVSDTQYILTFISLLIVGLIISNSAALLRDQVTTLRNKEYQMQALFNLSSELTGALSLQQVLDFAIQSVAYILKRKSIILLPENGALETKLASADFAIDTNEHAVAEWAFKHAQPAGRGTDTLPSAAVRFLPLNTAHGPIGILGLAPPTENADLLTQDQRTLLNGLANLIAQAIERVNLVCAATQSEMLRNTERLQSALLNSISHELRTPLASITGVLTSLSESQKSSYQAQRLDPDTQIELIDAATNQARQLNRLVENLLSITRLEAGSVRLNLEACDLQDVIGSVLQQFSTRLKDHPLRFEIPDNLPLVTCDMMFLAQVITNLLDNACKYTQPNTPIIIGAAAYAANVEMYIASAGQGAPEAHLERLFDKFYRSPLHQVVPGTGLGLPICKGILEAHGGWIRAEHNHMGGLTFRFSLPIQHTAETT